MNKPERLKHITAQITIFATELELDIEKLVVPYVKANKSVDSEVPISNFMTPKHIGMFSDALQDLLNLSIADLGKATIRSIARQSAVSLVNADSYDDEDPLITFKRYIPKPKNVDTSKSRQTRGSIQPCIIGSGVGSEPKSIVEQTISESVDIRLPEGQPVEQAASI